MRSRIEKTFKKLIKQGKKAFIPYIMAGDPSLDATKEIVLLFEECGADIVELGVPFSDPLADGPTIQRAAERALENGVTLRKVIALAEDLRQVTQIPLILMTYFNPVMKYGVENFVRDAAHAEVDGVIIPDLPPDEAGDLLSHANPASLNVIFLLAPTSTDERIKKVARASRGFIYYVSITGITGGALLIDNSLYASISKIKHFTKKPVAVGFGVSTPGEAAEVARLADGVIVGSAIIKKYRESPDTVKHYLASLRQAIQ
ncbi:MAG: tryptophan synthase subunit alpha [Thermodesulfovibrionales bacterium]|nr:tryptophan synthase subunit alpha [Thermodesulfovibrionales bacterium]